ncbi:DUF4184 family protein [Nocardioides sp. HM23]|uniref:DUF4184 family protein n=1 Tax=Nocardioides bizhenqiangii TaxID=3095076 RepID=UPI002AC9F6F5|nr:DUF4184 family protein [Nocardioides sp. HM23]MDZ5620439.1 DUF4184 family protein [Nocardioides sp. HM23]
MPMTLAHPAAVLPLRRSGLPMIALVAGSMVPDIPLFLSWVRGYEITHSLVGVLVVDVVLASVVVLVWFRWIRDAVVDMSPGPVRARLAEHVRLTSRQWLLVPLAGSVGAATHLLWDSFTHPGRWGPRHIEWLRTEHADLLGLKWVQYASGVLGLAVVIWVAVAYLRSLEPLPGTRRPPALPPSVLPVVIVTAGLVGLTSAAVSVPDGFHLMAFNGVVDGLIAATALGAAACSCWHLARRRVSDPSERQSAQE